MIRLFRKTFRPIAATYEIMDEVEVYRPRWLSLPGVGKRFDGWLMARGTLSCVRQVHENFRATIIDAHFLFPDGWAAVWIGRRLGLPVTITIRGSKDEWLIGTDREPMLVQAMRQAVCLFAVSEALRRDVAIRLGIDGAKVDVVANGINLERFFPVDRITARQRLNIDLDAKVIISVGNLIERKGFHRIIPLIKDLQKRYPKLIYLIVGGGATQGDLRERLERQVQGSGVSDNVRFCGPQHPDDLKWFYGAADIFALATEHEGWANVFLEAMACGLPVVTTRVGGNAEVVRNSSVGRLVEWWDPDEFLNALVAALDEQWDRGAIIAYAHKNTWDDRIARLGAVFRAIESGQ